jgi:hypothetical protein
LLSIAPQNHDLSVLPVAVPECGAQSLKPSDMPGKLENSQNSQDPEYLGSLGNILDRVLRGEKVQRDGDKEGEDAKKVNNIEEWKEEVKLKEKIYVTSFGMLEIAFLLKQSINLRHGRGNRQRVSLSYLGEEEVALIFSSNFTEFQHHKHHTTVGIEQAMPVKNHNKLETTSTF